MTGMKSLMKLKRCIVKLRRCMLILQPVRPVVSDDEGDSSYTRAALVPEGHFAVIAGKSEQEQTRFVLQLSYLKNPALLNLLKEAEEEFGFRQEGALVVPCRPEELQKILENNM